MLAIALLLLTPDAHGLDEFTEAKQIVVAW
jgi:hypothetical protein